MCMYVLSVPIVLTVVSFLGAVASLGRRRVLICSHSFVFWAAHCAKRTAVGTQLGLSE